MKPVELSEHAINQRSNIGSNVLDMFGGSGSTLIACQMTGRSAFLCELAPKYVDVICKRFQEYTGTLPVLEASGEARDFLRDNESKG